MTTKQSQESTESSRRTFFGRTLASAGAAVMATASRVYAPYESRFPGLPARMQDAAVAAWRWAQSNPDAVYAQPADIKTGGYDDEQWQDDGLWAAPCRYGGTLHARSHSRGSRFIPRGHAAVLRRDRRDG